MLHWFAYTALATFWALVVASSVVDSGESDLPDTATIIDILSSSAEYSLLLHQLQIHGLVPLINTARDITLLAPVNSAFQEIGSLAISKDLLLYHIINGTVATSDVTDKSIYSSCRLSPNTQIQEGMPVLLEKKEDTVEINHQVSIVSKDHFAGPRRGVVQAIPEFLDTPEKACETIGSLPDAKMFTKLLQIEYSCDKESLPQAMTFFIPADRAFMPFDNHEMYYLLSVHGGADRRRIINRHSVSSIVLPQNMKAHQNVTVLDGVDVNVNHDFVVNGALHPIATQIIASDAVIHVYDRFILTENEKATNSGIITITPQKYMYGLDADAFVRQLKFAELDDLINEKSRDIKQTIFIPTIPSESQHNKRATFIAPHEPSSLLYHFIEGQYSLEDSEGEIVHHQLLTTMYNSYRIGGRKQRIKFTSKKKTHGEWFLNGHQVLSREYRVGNTSIYLIDGDLDLPPSLSTAVGPFFQSSYSLEFLESLGLLDLPSKHKHGYTYVMPSRSAWEAETLVTNYLRKNDTALRRVFEGLIFKSPLYTDDYDFQNVTLLDNSVVEARALYDNSTQESFLQIGDDFLSICAEDILFDSGVVHSVEEVIIPEDVAINASDLISYSGRSEFLDLLSARNLSWALSPEQNFTILVPRYTSLAKDNITADTPDIDDILQMHLLPGNPIEDLLSGESTVETLRDDIQLSGRNASDRVFLISIANGLGNEAFVTDFGSTKGFQCAGTTVLFIDRYISPDWIKPPFIRPPFKLKTHVAMLIGAAVTIIIMFLVLGAILYSVAGKHKGTNGESGSSSPGERAGLLSPSDDQRTYGSDTSDGYTDVPNPTVSEPPTAPIRTAKVQEEREFGRHLNLPGRGGPTADDG